MGRSIWAPQEKDFFKEYSKLLGTYMSRPPNGVGINLTLVRPSMRQTLPGSYRNSTPQPTSTFLQLRNV